MSTDNEELEKFNELKTAVLTILKQRNDLYHTMTDQVFSISKGTQQALAQIINQEVEDIIWLDMLLIEEDELVKIVYDSKNNPNPTLYMAVLPVDLLVLDEAEHILDFLGPDEDDEDEDDEDDERSIVDTRVLH